MLWFTENTVPARRLRAIAAALLLMAGSPAAVQAGEGAGLLSPGDAVVTGFSGTLPPPDGLPDGADPLDYTFIDPDGAAMQVQRFLPAGPPAGQLIDAPALVTAPARDVGQVFAVTLDDAQAPNIYLGATSSFGIHIVAPGDDGTPPRGEPRARQGVTLLEAEWEGIRAGLAAYEGKKPQAEAPHAEAPLHARSALNSLLSRLWYLFDSRLGSLWFQTLCLLVLAASVVLGSGRFFLWQLGSHPEMRQLEAEATYTVRHPYPTSHRESF